MNHRNWIVALTAILLVAMFALNAFAVPEQARAYSKAEQQVIAQRVMNGQPVTPAEKAASIDQIRAMIAANRSTPPPATDLVGGPDAFGYRFIDSAEPGGPAFSWITPAGTNITGLADDNFTGPYPIGFTFNFYGTAYTEFYAGSNGRITFGAGNGTNYWMPLPLTGGDPAGIYFWNNDLHCGYTPTTVTYQNLTGPNRLVVTYNDLNIYGDATSHFDAQVILYESGEVICQYTDYVGTMVHAGGGIQNASGATYLPYYNDATYPPSGTAVMYYTLGQATDPIPANGATNVPTNAVLSWAAASGATGYDVYFGTDNPPMTMVSSNQAATNYTPAAIAPATVYYWQIVSRSATSTNAGPVWSFTSGAGAAPNAPSGGSVTDAQLTSLTMNWLDNSANETAFNVYNSTNGSNFTWLADAGANVVSYMNSGLNPASHYWYRVFATGAGGTSTGYADANGWTLPNVPGTPTIGAVGVTTIQVTITNNSTIPNGAAAQYALYETSTSMYVQADGSLGATPSWNAIGTTTVTGLTSGVSYTFQAKAMNGAGVESAFGPSVTQATNDVHAGGPDGGGYRYMDQVAPGGPTYNWITPSGAATTVSGWTSTDDGSAGPYNFGFNFTWYGTTYTQWYAGSNGRIQFGAQNPYNYTQAALPILSYPPGIYFWNGDMSVSSTVVQFENLTAPNRLVVTYTNLRNLGNTYGLDAQAIFYENGEVIMQFGPQTGTPSFLFSGIQSDQGTNYLTYPLMPTNGTAILYYTLGAPTNPIPADLATNVPTNATLSWTAGAGATGYDVYFGTDNPPATMVSSNQAGISYNPGTMATSTAYYWKVVSRMGTTTNAGPVWSFTTGAGAAPNAPTNAMFTSATTNSITGQFDDNSTDETGFPFWGSTDGTTFTYAFTAPGVAGTGTRSQTIIGLNAATHYWTRIYAEGPGGTSVNFTAANAWTLPAVPDAPTLGTPTFSTIPVTVNNNGANLNGALATYAIRVNGTSWVQANGSVGVAAVWQTLATWGTVTVNGLTGSTLYTFDVAAKNGNDDESAYSASASASTTSWSPNPNVYSPATGVLPAAISDNSTGDIPIIVTGTGSVIDIDVKISGTHTYTGDVDFELVHPNGTTVVGLFYNRGGSGDNWTNMILDDEGTAGIATGTAPFTGTWIPEQPLSTFDFLEGSGTWVLRWRDEAGGDVGFVTSVELAMSLNAAAPPGVPFGPTPANGAVAIGPNPVLGWSCANATSYDVYLGNTNPPTTAVSMGQTGTTYAAGPLSQSSVYYWYINAHNANGATAGPVWSFTTATPPTGLIANNTDANVTLNWNPSTGGAAAFMEDFNDGIAQNFSLTGALTIDGGYLKGACTGSGLWSFQAEYTAQNYTDVAVETDVQRVNVTDPGNSLAILIRGSGTMPGNNFSGYMFNITTTGYYSIWRVDAGAGVQLVGWTTSAFINTGLGVSNIQRVTTSGSTMNLYANGNLLASVSDATYSSGHVSIAASDGTAGSDPWWNYVSISTAFTPAPPIFTGATPTDMTNNKFVPSTSAFCSYPAVSNPFNELRGGLLIGNEIDAFLNYRIYRNSTLLATTTDTSYADVLPSYGTYTYYVTSVYTEGESNPTNNAVVTWLPPTPGDPTALTITYTGGNAVLSWTGSTGTVTGYHIYRYETGYFTPPTTGTLIGSTDNATLTYTDTGVNGQYYYRVTAYNGIATSSIPTGGNARVVRTLTPTTR